MMDAWNNWELAVFAFGLWCVAAVTVAAAFHLKGWGVE